MSDTNSVEQQKPNAEGQAAAQTLEERFAQLEQTNKRLLGESKEYKSKYQQIKEDADKRENEVLTQKEDYKKLLEKEREKSLGIESRLGKLKAKTINKSLDFEVARYAPDAEDFEIVKQSLPRDLLDAVEEDDDIKLVGVKEALDKLKSEKPFLFKKKVVPAMVQGKPGAGSVTQPGKKELKDLTLQEKVNLLVRMKQAEQK